VWKLTSRNHLVWLSPTHAFLPGYFCTKESTAYKVAVQRREDEKGRSAENSESLPKEISVFRWDKIWGMEVPNKVKIFVWRLIHNSLAVRRNLAVEG
jgi:hypothetical protein